MFMFLQYIIAFLFVLSVVVVLHEFGHFITARLFGVQVVEFSFGFGRELFGRTDKRGTRWKVCLVPLGGYVKMLGDEDASSASHNIEGLSEDEKSHSFAFQKTWKKALIIFAGPFMNYFSAVVILTGIFFSLGDFVIPPIVGNVMPDYPAAQAGIQKGDIILSINEHEVKDFSDVSRITQILDYGKTLTIKIKRQDEVKEVSLTPKNKDGVVLIGVMSSEKVDVIQSHLSLSKSFSKAVMFSYDMTADTLRYLGQVLTGKRSAKEMRGPIGIAEASGEASKQGGLSLLLFIVQISIGIGFMNLLPIPVLDGGHLFLFAVEGIIRRPLNEKIQRALMGTGLFLLMSLFLWTILQDVPRIIQRIFE
ncbi:MAG: RIP metalloprotease RseP [Alphaproteobacteria bacterium]|nr:RIP metalloprotease RseP [Alphaproteobacteria bacterium]